MSAKAEHEVTGPQAIDRIVRLWKERPQPMANASPFVFFEKDVCVIVGDSATLALPREHVAIRRAKARTGVESE